MFLAPMLMIACRVASGDLRLPLWFLHASLVRGRMEGEEEVLLLLLLLRLLGHP
jgi:hypothetical protein